VLDPHAGAGIYDLSSPEASRSGEWRTGIGRLIAAPLAAEARALLAPYLDAVKDRSGGGALKIYPGDLSRLADAGTCVLRQQDRLIACEFEPNAAAALGRALRGDRRSKAIAIDGWTALNAYLPPKERRGLVLIDPAFEHAADFSRLVLALEGAQRKWASGIYLAWYPIKEGAASASSAKRVCRSCKTKVLRAELDVTAPRNDAGNRLRAAG
jgi:23S rRNA (adenine2030-N6)-methyltransferase